MTDATASPLDRIAPNSTEAEEAVLGSILINPGIFEEVADILVTEDFFIVRNGMVWDSIVALSLRSDAIDNLTVIQELTDRGKLEIIGGSAYIKWENNNAPTRLLA